MPAKNNFDGQAFHRKWTAYPQDINTLDHAYVDVRPDGRTVTAGSPQAWTLSGLLSELWWGTYA